MKLKYAGKIEKKNDSEVLMTLGVIILVIIAFLLLHIPAFLILSKITESFNLTTFEKILYTMIVTLCTLSMFVNRKESIYFDSEIGYVIYFFFFNCFTIGMVSCGCVITMLCANTNIHYVNTDNLYVAVNNHETSLNIQDIPMYKDLSNKEDVKYILRLEDNDIAIDNIDDIVKDGKIVEMPYQKDHMLSESEIENIKNNNNKESRKYIGIAIVFFVLLYITEAVKKSITGE